VRSGLDEDTDYLEKDQGDILGRRIEGCGSELVIRAAKKGNNPGREFWACSKFPQCRFTKPCRNGR
jgi:ssDNA-binding Zn-finger/Zn-ribbon topoisomerase 1